MSEYKIWIAAKPTDGSADGVRVLTDAQDQIFCMGKPDDVEEMVILHNAQMANANAEIDAQAVKIAELEDEIRDIQDEVADYEKEYAPTTWVDVFESIAVPMGVCLGIALVILAASAVDVIHAIKGNPVPVVVKNK